MENKIIYSNAVELKLQYFDAQINFKLNDANNGDVESTTVVLSPQHLKVLCNILNNGLAVYEQQFGEITVPGDIVEQ